MSIHSSTQTPTNKRGVVHGRIIHIDWLRGIAVLLMVMVHAAATWQPTEVSTTSLLAYVVSGLGGLAAPLFVTLTGWGLSKTNLSAKKIIVRFVFFFIMQFILNISAPHLFEPFTPGVLSLFALLTLSTIFWKKLSNINIVLLMGFLLFLPSIIDNPLSWEERVHVDGLMTFLNHLIWTGTYPLFPWLIFALLGHLIAQKAEAPTNALMLSALLLQIGAVLISSSENIPFASPSGIGVLTFFPANTPFLIGAMLGVGIIWKAVERYSFNWQPMSALGQRSLTVYILHFLPFYYLYQLDEVNNWSATFCAIVVLLYTLLWLPLMHHLARSLPSMSFEKLLRSFTTQPNK